MLSYFESEHFLMGCNFFLNLFLFYHEGKMFPTTGDLHIAPFFDDALYMEHFSKANFWLVLFVEFNQI